MTTININILTLLLIISYSSCKDDCSNSTTIIDVSKDNINQTSCRNVRSNVVHCPNIESAFKIGNLNHSCIRIRDNQTLNNIIQLSNIADLVLIKYNGSYGNVTINCSPNDEAGFGFNNLNSISVFGLNFHHCGVKQQTSNSKTLLMSTAFYLYHVQNVKFVDVSIISSKGYGIVLIDVSGNLFFERVNIIGGTLVPNIIKGKQIKGCSSGGGIYLQYSSSALERYPSNFKVNFNFCQFLNNTADGHNVITNGSTSHEFKPFAKGGGLTLIFFGKVQSTDFCISDCIFANNFAAWGGGIYIHFRENVYESKIILDRINFTKNKANISGGGLIITSRYLSRQFEDVMLSNSSFYENSGRLGSALHLHNTHVKIVDLKLSSTSSRCSPTKLLSTSARNKAGGLYAFESILKVYGINSIKCNRNTAFILDSSRIYVKGQLNFDNNIGYNGGALSLIGRSYIILGETAILIFRNNRAIKNGGAIYVSISYSVVFPENVPIQMFPCFFIFEPSDSILHFNGSVTFENNTCNNSGEAIFTSTLQNCRYVDKSAGGMMKQWKNFKFSPVSQTIATNAVKVSIFRDNWVVWPGELFHPTIKLLDEQNNTVDEAIDIDIKSEYKNIKIETSHRFLVQNNYITLRLLSGVIPSKPVYKFEKAFNITVALSRDDSIKTSEQYIMMASCTFGFTFEKTRCICNVQKNRVRGIAPCYDNKAYIYKDRWAAPNQTALDRDEETTQVCPPNYCRKNCPGNVTGHECPYSPEINQCNVNRSQSSRLCSQCNKNLSVAFAGEDCMRCGGKNRYNVIWAVLAIVFILFIVIMVILLLNVDFYFYYLNGLFYYYQVVGLLLPVSFDAAIAQFTHIINLFGPGGSLPPFCLWNGLNDLQKMLFNYIFPVTMILILIIVSAFVNRRQQNIISQLNCIRAFITISIWAYSDITRITFQLLSYDTINGSSYVTIYAEAKSTGHEYLPYLIIACVVLIIVVLGFPIMLLMSSFLMGCHCRNYANPLARWQLVFDSFKYCFKPNREFFVSYYFLCRLLFLAVTTFWHKNPEEDIVLALICLLICMVFQVSLPYKDTWMNVFDVMVLGNLTAISILSLAERSVHTRMEIYICKTAINVLMYIPVVIVALRILHVVLPKLKKALQKRFNGDNGGEEEDPLKRRLLDVTGDEN